MNRSGLLDLYQWIRNVSAGCEVGRTARAGGVDRIRIDGVNFLDVTARSDDGDARRIAHRP